MNDEKTPEPWRSHYAHPGSWEQDFPALSLPDLFAGAVAEHGARPLVEFYGRTFSYAALHEEALRFADGLKAWGIRPGDRVGLFLPNVPIYVPAYYGAMMAGATVVNFSPLYTVEELAQQVGCAEVSLRKIEGGDLHPSAALAASLARALAVA